MREVDIPGGKATLRESDDLRAMDADLIEEFFTVASPAFAKMPEEVREGKRTKEDGTEESDEEAMERLAPLMASVQYSREEARALVQLRRATIIACLDSWTRPEEIPTTVEELGHLPRDLVQALDKAIGGLGAVLQPGVDFTPSREAESPTVESFA